MYVNDKTGGSRIWLPLLIARTSGAAAICWYSSSLEFASDHIPQCQQNCKQGDVGGERCGGDADDAVSEVVQKCYQCTQDRGGQHGLGELLAEFVGEEEGKQQAEDGVHNSQYEAEDQAQSAHQQRTDQTHQQDRRAVGDQQIGQKAPGQTGDKIVDDHGRDDGQKAQYEPAQCRGGFPVRQNTVGQVIQQHQNHHGEDLAANDGKIGLRKGHDVKIIPGEFHKGQGNQKLLQIAEAECINDDGQHINAQNTDAGADCLVQCGFSAKEKPEDQADYDNHSGNDRNKLDHRAKGDLSGDERCKGRNIHRGSFRDNKTAAGDRRLLYVAVKRSIT